MMEWLGQDCYGGVVAMVMTGVTGTTTTTISIPWSPRHFGSSDSNWVSDRIYNTVVYKVYTPVYTCIRILRVYLEFGFCLLSHCQLTSWKIYINEVC